MPYIASGGGAWIAEASLAARGKAWDVALEKGLAHDTDYLRKNYPALLAA